jgi:hypothetical protein
MQNTESRKVMTCPLNGKLCLEGKREDFQRDDVDVPVTCRWWVHLYGKDPQSEKILDQYDCSIAWLPVTTVETSQMSRQSSASFDKVATQISEMGGKLGGAIKDMVNAFLHLAETNREVLDYKRTEPTTIEVPPNGKHEGEN